MSMRASKGVIVCNLDDHLGPEEFRNKVGKNPPRLIDDGIFRRWQRGKKVIVVEAVHAENAARVCRRTMKPWAILTHERTGKRYEAVCYPFVEDGQPMIKVRVEIGEPGELVDFLCTEMRPIKFEPRVTGVPANDPLPIGGAS